MNFPQMISDHQQFFTPNWEQLYNQLLFSYYQLSQNYRTTVNKNLQLTQELKQKTLVCHQAEKLFVQNVSKVESKKTLPEYSEAIEETVKEVEKMEILRPIKKKRSQRKEKSMASNLYTCSYSDCNRSYDSTVSLNLHIKLKHNGGTKKQRQTYAKMIIDAEQKGLEPPKININFPPNFIEVNGFLFIGFQDQLQVYQKVQYVSQRAKQKGQKIDFSNNFFDLLFMFLGRCVSKGHKLNNNRYKYQQNGRLLFQGILSQIQHEDSCKINPCLFRYPYNRNERIQVRRGFSVTI